MKRIFISLYLLLAATMSVAAQARFTSNTECVSFGQVAWKNPVTAQYVISNTGDAPLVLTEVEPDCACTAAKWTQTPIAPGEKGTVSVTFDAEMLGHFHKSVAVYTNAEPHVAYLSLEGKVVQRLTDFTRTHPYRMGDIRVSMDALAFDDVTIGEKPTLLLSIANLSNRPYTPVLMHLPGYLKAEVKPHILQEGETGTITVTLDTEHLADYGLTETNVYVSRFMGDKVGNENVLPFSVVLLPDFSRFSASDEANAPTISLSATDLDVSALLAKKSKVHQDITLTNTGRSVLQIGKLQVLHPAVGVSLKKSTLQPGESTRLRVTVNKKHLKRSIRPLKLLMITNDPTKAKVEINVKVNP